MKKRLEKLLKAKKEQRDALNNSMIESESREERAEIGETLAAIRAEIEDIETVLAEIDEPADGGEGESASGDENGEGRAFNPIASMTMRTGAPAANVDRYDTEEYRTAFMNFVCRGEVIPANLRATTLTTDVSAAIPTTYLNEIVKTLKSYGNIYAAVRKLTVQGGVEIPIADLKPVASWVGDTASEAQKLTANTSISFKYFGLECKIAQSLLVSVTTLDAFQELFVELATEAIAKALDVAIIGGTGTNQPTGVTVDSRVPSANVVTLTDEEFKSWSGWKQKVFGKMKKAYRNGNFYMAQGTFDGYIDGMVDSVGQPIGRVNYGIDGGEKYRFGGKNVETVEDDVIKAYDDATAGDIVAVFFNPSDYGINSNLELKTVKWIDHDTNEVKTKVILVCDGKLIDPNGVVIVKKGA
jgi:HK97 family phage major capsid protein